MAAKLKILLISPVADPSVKTSEGLMIPQLALHILRSLTPPEHDVKIVEEEIESVNMDEECDLVGISCMTSNAPRAYMLAEEFRKRGKKVILGGVHPTILYDEAIKHCDSVVVGEAEPVWEQAVRDFQQGVLKEKYHAESPSLDKYIPLKYRELTKKRIFSVVPIMTTRGCPYQCEFCCVSSIFGKKIRHLPVSNLVRDLSESRNRFYIFLDDNIMGDPSYAKELFKAIKPFKIKWVGQSSISFVHDRELMELAVESGCAGLFFGVESVSEVQLKRMAKSIKELKKIDEAIRIVKDLGIHFHASIVFGFDSDTKEIFAETLDFLNRNKVGSASLNILTPYPGTRIYEQLKSEGRLLTDNWKYYDHSTTVFRPKNMTPYELQAGTNWIKQEYTKMSSILRRLSGNTAHPLLYLALNFGLRKSVKAETLRLPFLYQDMYSKNS